MRRVAAHLRSAASTVTSLGWGVLVIGVVTWFVSWRLGWTEFAVITATCVLLFVIGASFTIGRLDLSSEIRVEPSRVVVGDRAAGELLLTNERSRTVRSLRIELPVGKAVAAYSVSVLKGGATTDELFVVPTNRRAIIPVGPTATVQGDPVGLFRRTRTWSDVEEIYVHPKTVPLMTMAAGLIRDMEGQETNQLSPSDVAFHALRDYEPGDDRRHIHWRSSAKLGQLLVRQYVDTRRSHVAVLLSLNLDEYTNEDEFELAVSCAASTALQALRDDQTLSVFAGGARLDTGNPRRMLDRFSGIEGVPGGEGLDTAIIAAQKLAPDASVAVLCVGSEPPVSDIRRAASRLSVDTKNVVLRSALGSEPSYHFIGTSRFVNVPGLESLNRTLSAVMA